MAERFKLTDFAYAHRGLWTHDGLPENSLAACEAAAEVGLGIEFDVRPSADGIPILFHDPELDRMTAHTGAAVLRSAEQLGRIRLNGSEETIPTFQELLDMWPRKTPLLTEMKIDGSTDPAAFARQISEMMTRHDGPAAVMSFHPKAVAALPNTLMRGQLVRPIAYTDTARFEAMLGRAQSMGADYVCVWQDDAAAALEYIKDNGLSVAAYTIDTTDQLARLKAVGKGLAELALIFEGFDPALARP